MNIRRGDMYYIDEIQAIGSEQRGGRPAVIVSNDTCNIHSPVVEVVFLTTAPKNNLPTHVTIRSAPRISTALCEQVHSVAVDRLSRFCGRCTAQEMAAVDIALSVSLGLDICVPAAKEEQIMDEPSPVSSDVEKLIAAQAQLALLEKMYSELLNRWQQVTVQNGRENIQTV